MHPLVERSTLWLHFHSLSIPLLAPSPTDSNITTFSQSHSEPHLYNKALNNMETCKKIQVMTIKNTA